MTCGVKAASPPLGREEERGGGRGLRHAGQAPFPGGGDVYTVCSLCDGSCHGTPVVSALFGHVLYSRKKERKDGFNLENSEIR